MTAGWEPQAGQFPWAPLNGMVATPYKAGIHDIRWDNPAILSGNTAYHVVGVNVYRSESSDRGPFFRLNEFPIGGGFYRDRTDITYINRERVDWNTSWVFQGDGPNDRLFKLRTQYRITKRDMAAPYQQPIWGNAPGDVKVWVDGVEAEIQEVFGRTGEVTLVNEFDFDPSTEKNIDAVLPGENSTVEVSYWTARNYVPMGMDKHVWYRLTTVAIDSSSPSGYTETPFGQSRPTSLMEVEVLDYIWKEAVRRNRWIQDQGGERVSIFVQKVCGIPCNCTRDPKSLEFSKQPQNFCLRCYGTGFVGGYDGPYDSLIVPDDSEHRIAQTQHGRHKAYTYEVWMGPSPVVTQRDFVVKQTNERYSIGAVRRPTNRGNLLQQHFQIGALDYGDVRYRVPIDGTTSMFLNPETRTSLIPMPRTPVDGGRSYEHVEGWEDPAGAFPEGPFKKEPQVTEKGPNAPVSADKEQRGRTRAWENQSY